MLSISRFSASNRLALESVREALLALGFLYAQWHRPRNEDLSEHLRRDLGFLPRSERPADLRDLRW